MICFRDKSLETTFLVASSFWTLIYLDRRQKDLSGAFHGLLLRQLSSRGETHGDAQQFMPGQPPKIKSVYLRNLSPDSDLTDVHHQLRLVNKTPKAPDSNTERFLQSSTNDRRGKAGEGRRFVIIKASQERA